MPAVSVILNTYNRAALVPRAIKSVFGQTTGDWELFICDDASDDGTGSVVAEYLDDPRVTYLRQPRRTGNVTCGRNDALDRTTGQYVCFLDDDNAMAPTKLERMMAFLTERPETGMAYCRSQRLGMDGSLLDLLPMNKPDRFERDRLRELNYIDSGEVMIRREVFDRAGCFDERAIRFEDWEIWNRIAAVTSISALDEPLSWYCTHPAQRVLEPGNDEDNLRTRELFNWKLAHGYPRWRVVVVWPTPGITQSQRDCMAAIEADLDGQDWIAPTYTDATGKDLRQAVDEVRPALVIFWMLFRHPMESLEAMRGSDIPRIGVCVEDPYALHETMPRARLLSAVVTNDASAAQVYRESGQTAAMIMPTLSVCESWDQCDELVKPTHDVILIGYAYPERTVILRNLALEAPELSFLAIGGGWPEAILPDNVTREGDIARPALIENYRRGRVILVLNRVQGSPGHVLPTTPARGFIEAATGRPVVHDVHRSHLGRYFEIGREVEVGHNLKQILERTRALVADPECGEIMGKAGRRRAYQYTYRRRWRRMVHSLMAARIADIP